MFVVSLSSKKLKNIFLCISALILISVSILSTGFFSSRETGFAVNETEVMFDVSASSAEERLAFIEQFGWVVDKTPIEILDIVIPEEFNDVYKNYNEIQINQGLNLEKYSGVRVKRWTYTVRNYPGYPADADYIRINLLVHNGAVIGGDVCSLKLDGFMHGFKKE